MLLVQHTHPNTMANLATPPALYVEGTGPVGVELYGGIVEIGTPTCPKDEEKKKMAMPLRFQTYSERTPRLPQTARVVLALGHGPQGQPIVDAFHRQGWEVFFAATEQDARRLVQELKPRAIVLCANPKHRESGWLTCKKLLLAQANLRIVLVHPSPTEADRRLADFVGAVAYLSSSAAGAIVRAAAGVDLSSVN